MAATAKRALEKEVVKKAKTKKQPPKPEVPSGKADPEGQTQSGPGESGNHGTTVEGEN